MRRIANLPRVLRGAGVLLLCMIAASAVGDLFLLLGLQEANIAIVYLLAVHLTARFTDGYAYGFAASFLGALAFNYLFIEPHFSFAVHTHSYFVTFAIMIITSIVTGTLTTHARQNAREAQRREAEAKALYTLTNHLTDAPDTDGIAAVVVSTVSELLGRDAGCLLFDESGAPEKAFLQQAGARQIHRALPKADLNRLSAIAEEPFGGPEFRDFPIRGREAVLGVLRVPNEAASSMSEAQARMLPAMIESAALALDRVRATRQRQMSSEETERERYRGNLLRSISHDLRTPLTGIMGTAEVLRSMTETGDVRYPYIEEIYEDADWLHALVENILGLTRLQEGKLVPHRELEAAEEVVGAAVRQISRRYPAREIEVSVPEELFMVPMDMRLISQVLVNLLDNAARHTPGEGTMGISVARAKDVAVFRVYDEGEGIAEEDLPNIFQSFYTSRIKAADARRGVGLGLAICDAVVRAHGGTISARNRVDGPGAEFSFTLPLKEESNDPE